MQNRNPPPCFFANNTGAANGDDDCQMNPLDIFSSSRSFNTTNSALDIEYNGPNGGVSPSINWTPWSIPGGCGGNLSANTLLHSGRNSWYCSGTISSKGRFFKSFASMALLISYIEALNTVSLPFLTVQKNEAPLSMTSIPRNSRRGRISVLNTYLTWYTGSGGSFVTPCTVSGASWQGVMQYCDLNVTVFDAKRTATSCSRNHEIPRIIG